MPKDTIKTLKEKNASLLSQLNVATKECAEFKYLSDNLNLKIDALQTELDRVTPRLDAQLWLAVLSKDVVRKMHAENKELRKLVPATEASFKFINNDWVALAK